jgi:hypothetical protein
VFYRKLKASESLLAKAEEKPWRGDSHHHISGGQKSDELRRPSAKGPRAHATHDIFSLARKMRGLNVIV